MGNNETKVLILFELWVHSDNLIICLYTSKYYVVLTI